MQKRSATLALALAVSGGCAAGADAAVIGWGSPVGGSFFDSSKWERGAVPDTRDDVVFDARGSYSVTLNKSHANSRMLVGDDAINLNLNGHKYRLKSESSGSVLLGLSSNDASALNLSNGILRSSKGRLAYAPNSYASVNILPGATWRNTGPLVVGHKGTADMTINGGTVVSNGGRIGTATRDRGTVTLTGPTATWRVGEGLHVGGHRAKGKLTLTNGASVIASSHLTIGERGKVILDGGTLIARSIRNPDNLIFREGILDLRDQRLNLGDSRPFGERLKLSTGKTLKLRRDARIHDGSSLDLRGGTFRTTSTVDNDGLIRMRQGSLLAAKSVHVTNTLAGAGDIRGDVLFAETGNLLLHLGGRNPGVSYDRIVIDGDATLTNVEVRFRNDFVPREGDHFELVVADDVTYAPGFSIKLPDLPQGLLFDVKQDDTCLHVYVVVPEPAAIGMLLGAGLLLMARRHR